MRLCLPERSGCYRRTSKNHKGEYHYDGCGCRQRNGRDACDNAASIREDLLMQRVKQTYQEVFADADSIIEDAIEEAWKLMQSNRGELRRIGGKIAELDRKIGSLTRLLVDPDIDATAKHAVSRQVGELETERKRLQSAVAELASDAKRQHRPAGRRRPPGPRRGRGIACHPDGDAGLH